MNPLSRNHEDKRKISHAASQSAQRKKEFGSEMKLFFSAYFATLREPLLVSALLPCYLADNISLTISSVTLGSSPSVCPLSMRTTSATTFPSAQFG
jgi:hypothetical protein